MSREELISKLRALPDQFTELVNGLSDEDLTTPFLLKDDGTPEWTVAQNVHHVADAHINSYIRCKLVLTENEPTIQPFDHDQWAEQLDARSADVSTSIAILRSVHNRWAQMFENLSEGEWNRIGHHPESGSFLIAHQLEYYANHGEWHIDQIQRTLAAKGHRSDHHQSKVENRNMGRKELIKKIGALPGQIEVLVKDLNDTDLTSHYLMKDDGTPEWTVAQNVHHLADSHMNSYVRCKLMITEDNPTIRPYDQDAWADQPEAKSADLTHSLAILHSLHNRWVLFWQNLEEDDWSRMAFHPESGPFTLDDQLQLYVDHGEGHIEQIQRTLAAKH